MQNSPNVASFLLAALILPLGSCGDSHPSDPAAGGVDAGATQSVSSAEDAYWSNTPLAGAKEVRDARESAKDGDAVVLRGTLQDFGELSTFRLVDDGLKDCTENPDDACESPWDFCCEDPDELQRWTVNVEFLEDGVPGDWTLKGQHGLDRLSEVIVAGTFRKDEAGNLRLEAERLSLQ